MRFSSHLLVFSLLNLHGSLAFPSYGTLAGLSRSELDAILPTLKRGVLESPPGPLQDTSAKLVNDEKHPWKPAGKHDIRGPCPGLNTLASHGVGLPTVGLNKRGSWMLTFLSTVASEKWSCYSWSNRQCRSRRFVVDVHLLPSC
jgi:hypothetical protein